MSFSPTLNQKPTSLKAVPTNQPHVLTILPRGEAIRNFVYAGALAELQKHAAVSLLSVVPNDELWRDLQTQCPNTFPLRDNEDPWLLWLLREELDLAHGRWLWSAGAQARWELREQETHNWRETLKRVSKRLACFPFVSRPGLRVLSRLESAASQQFRKDDEYLKLFQRLQPSLVFNASHVHSRAALPAVHAARALGIPTATFVFSWDNLTSQGRIYPPYDFYLVWNEALRDGLLEIYDDVRPEQVFVTSTPQFDFHFRPEFHWTRAEFCQRVGADPARPLVVYTTGMANHIGGEPWIVERIADGLQQMTDLGPPQLLVRVLPKGPQGHFDELRQRRPDILIPPVQWEQNWLTPTLADAFMLTNTLRHADVGINVASTITLELCMFDKPVINVSYLAPHLDVTKDFDYRRYYDFEHYRPVVASGALSLAHSDAEMMQLIRQALLNPAAQAPQRASLIQDFFGTSLDGRGGVRLAETLRQLAVNSAARPTTPLR